MEENIDVISFAEPSKAYQALHILKETDAQARIGLLEAAVVERTSDGRLQMNEVEQGQGALVEPIVYALGGPLSVLLADPDLLAGESVDLAKARQDDPSLKQIADRMLPGSTVLIADVVEVADEVLDKEMSRLGGTITRRSADVVAQEIEAADEAKRAADKEARRVLREQHKAERQAAMSQKQAQMEQQVAQQQTAFKQKMADLRQAHQQKVAEIKAKLQKH